MLFWGFLITCVFYRSPKPPILIVQAPTLTPQAPKLPMRLHSGLQGLAFEGCGDGGTVGSGSNPKPSTVGVGNGVFQLSAGSGF